MQSPPKDNVVILSSFISHCCNLQQLWNWRLKNGHIIFTLSTVGPFCQRVEKYTQINMCKHKSWLVSAGTVGAGKFMTSFAKNNEPRKLTHGLCFRGVGGCCGWHNFMRGVDFFYSRCDQMSREQKKYVGKLGEFSGSVINFWSCVAGERFGQAN